MRSNFACRLVLALSSLLLAGSFHPRALAEEAGAAPVSERLLYNHAGLVVDLGVGLWAQPLPMDFDGDGDLDLVVATADVPSNGLYFFENTEGRTPFPIFEAGVRLDAAEHNITISYTEDGPRILTPGAEHPEFVSAHLGKPLAIPFTPPKFGEKIRANQWKYCDYDGDGARDLVIGVGVWDDYGWDNAFDAEGHWTRGPLHGYVYWVKNTGSNERPRYVDAAQVLAGDGPVDVYGCPSPNFADFDADGDLDLLCGEFLDRLTYFENLGTRTGPRYARGRFLEHDGAPIRLDLEMLQVVACDWDEDGDPDLIVGEEDGRVAFVEHSGQTTEGLPAFLPPRHFQQKAHAVKTGALATPYACDWDGDGDTDLVAGDTAGYIHYIENLDGGAPPKWARPVRLEAEGETIRVQAGPNGSIQGPAEAKWGYTVVCVADWDHDGRLDILRNSIWGKIEWHRNIGAPGAPKLAKAAPIEVEWEGETLKPAWFWWKPQGKQLVTQWRTSPVAIDWTGDALLDLVLLDHEGYLALFERRRAGGALTLQPGRRIFTDGNGAPLRLSDREAGKSGRRKFCFADWDGDGVLDLLLNSGSVDLWRGAPPQDGRYAFTEVGSLDARRLAGHTTCPTVVDWDKNGVPDLLTGAEDGFYYYLHNPRTP